MIIEMLSLLLICASMWSSGVAGAPYATQKRPLHVCTSSIQDFGARCDASNGQKVVSQRTGLRDSNGTCPGGLTACGYDISVFEQVAIRVQLKLSIDYVHICFESGDFDSMIDTLAGGGGERGHHCDVGASTISATTERLDRKIEFSRAIYQSALAVMVYEPPRDLGMWAFLRPLHTNVWIALVLTVAVTPFLVFFAEAIFSERHAYPVTKSGKVSLLKSLTEVIWASVSQALLLDKVAVYSTPARIILAGFSFLVLTVSNTYTANLISFLTTSRIDIPYGIEHIRARGGLVATIPPYVERIRQQLKLDAVSDMEWNYEQMVAGLQAGEYSALISDDKQLESISRADRSCSLHILDEKVLPFETAFAFRRGFEDSRLKRRVDDAILEMQASGTLQQLEDKFSPPERRCTVLENLDTKQVGLNTVRGLWVIIAVACTLATLVSVIRYAYLHRHDRAQAQHLDDHIHSITRQSADARTIGADF